MCDSSFPSPPLLSHPREGWLRLLDWLGRRMGHGQSWQLGVLIDWWGCCMGVGWIARMYAGWERWLCESFGWVLLCCGMGDPPVNERRTQIRLTNWLQCT